MAKKQDTMQAEWSHFFNVEELSKAPARLEISANEDQRDNLARRFDLPALGELKVSYTIDRRAGDGVVHVAGRLKASLTQSCVVSGDPVESQIEDDFEAWYADPAQVISIEKARRDKEIKAGKGELPMVDESEDPEAMVDGQIDLGELAAQHLSLMIDPYPHAPGVHFEAGDDTLKAQGEVIPNPFAKLKEWKDQQK